MSVKINITKNSNGSTIKNKNGDFINGVKSIYIEAKVNEPSMAFVTLSCLEADIEVGECLFNIAGHKDIVSLVDKNGNIINLASGVINK